MYDTQFATDLTFANYVDALIGDDIGVVGEAAELLSCGDVMRYGPICAQLEEARIVQFGIATLKKVTKTTTPHVLRCPERSGATLDLLSLTALILSSPVDTAKTKPTVESVSLLMLKEESKRFGCTSPTTKTSLDTPCPPDST